MRYPPRERFRSRPGLEPDMLTVSPLATRTGPTEPVIVRLPTEIDMANAEDTGEQLRSAFTPGVTLVIADLTPTVFCDSAGARQLALAHRSADALAAQVRFVIPHLDMLRVLQVLGLDRLLSIHPSLETAASAGPAPDRAAASG
jgi:anti-sigma B factor antagonist